MTLPSGVQPGRAYADPAYAASLAEHGRPLALPASGATVLLVPIAGTDRVDAVAPYPLLSCPWPEHLADDLAIVAAAGAVTLTAVLDPMRPLPPPESLARFDLARPFKRHFVTALDDGEHVPSRGHRRSVARSRARVTVEVVAGSATDPDRWWALWQGLVRAAGLTGMRAPSRDAFARQLALDGAMTQWAEVDGAPVAAQIALVTPDAAYAHVAVSDPVGRATAAMHALDAVLLDRARGAVPAVHWGGTAGAHDADDGLAAYKRGWSNRVRQAWLVGAVLDRAAHAALGGRLPLDPAAWFPAWRAPRATSP